MRGRRNRIQEHQGTKKSKFKNVCRGGIVRGTRKAWEKGTTERKDNKNGKITGRGVRRAKKRTEGVVKRKMGK